MSTKLSMLERKVSTLQRTNRKMQKEITSYLKASESRHLGQPTSYNREDSFQPATGADYLQLYETYTHVFSCVDAIARNVAKLPFRIYKLKSLSATKDRRGEEVTDGSIWQLFNMPNKFTSGYGLIYGIVAFIKLVGTSYLEKVGANSAEPTELWLLRPDWMRIRADAIKLIGGYDYTVDGQVIKYSPEEILRIKSWHPRSEFYGLGVPTPAQNSIITDLYAMKYSKQFFKQGGHLSWYLTAKDEVSDASYKRLEQQLKSKFGGLENAHTPALFDSGMELKELGGSPDRNVLLPQKTLSRDEVCENFGVPALMLGLPNETHYNNADAQYLFFWEQTAQPVGRELEDTINREILWPLDMEGAFDYSGIQVLQPNVVNLAQAGKTLVDGKMMLPNEVRAKVLVKAFPDLQPIEGGDAFPAAASPFGSFGGAPEKEPAVGPLEPLKGVSLNLVLKLLELAKGGSGSGHHEHFGRPGGGSHPRLTVERIKEIEKDVFANRDLDAFDKLRAHGLTVDEAKQYITEAKGCSDTSGVIGRIKPRKPKPGREEIKKAVVAHRDTLFNMCLPDIQKVISDGYQEYGEAVMGVVGVNIKKVAFIKKDMVAEAVRSLDPVTKKMAQSLLKTEKGLLKKIIAEEFKRTKAKPLDQEAADELEGRVDKHLDRIVERSMKSVSDTAKERVEKHLTDLIESDATVDTITKDITSLLGEEAGHARNIARTETLKFTETGRFATLTEMGFTEKEWFHSGHDDPRPSHLAADGEVVKMNEKFSTGLQFPGDPDGEAEDVCNCGCTFAEHVGAATEEE